MPFSRTLVLLQRSAPGSDHHDGEETSNIPAEKGSKWEIKYHHAMMDSIFQLTTASMGVIGALGGVILANRHQLKRDRRSELIRARDSAREEVIKVADSLVSSSISLEIWLAGNMDVISQTKEQARNVREESKNLPPGEFVPLDSEAIEEHPSREWFRESAMTFGEAREVISEILKLSPRMALLANDDVANHADDIVSSAAKVLVSMHYVEASEEEAFAGLSRSRKLFQAAVRNYLNPSS